MINLLLYYLIKLITVITYYQTELNSLFSAANQEEGNRLVNQLLEEAEKGTVSQWLVDKIKTSEAYKTQVFVREILDSVVETQQQHQQAQQPKIRKQSVTKMSIMARQNSKDVAPPTTVVIPPKLSSRQSSKDQQSTNQDQAAAMIMIGELPDVVKNQKHQDSVEERPDLVTDDTALMVDGRFSLSDLPEIQEFESNNKKADELEEIEEEVCSTDFEDLDIDDDDEFCSQRGSADDNRSQAESFASAEDQVPEIRTVPATPKPAGQREESPFNRGLSKRLSRGKYEKSKFIFGREVSIEESPRLGRKRIGGVQPDPKEAPELFDRAKQYILEYPDNPNSPEFLDPSARKMEWLRTADPDMGSSQEVESPPRTPNGSNNVKDTSTRHSTPDYPAGYKVLWPHPPDSEPSETGDTFFLKPPPPPRQTRHYVTTTTLELQPDTGIVEGPKLYHPNNNNNHRYHPSSEKTEPEVKYIYSIPIFFIIVHD